ncbi:MAG: transposase [Sphingobacteriales bacterium JAD_PAG50586_3]|nr:MAG: transposase [Sphingobacteriales bacterium JAD_PAG50586_3]
MLATFNIHNPPYFFTATILNWFPVLEEERYKEIITNSLKYLTNQNRVTVYGFVIMPNHIHIIWSMNEVDTKSAVQRDFLKYTSQQIKRDLEKTNPALLDERFLVEAVDRKYQLWERRPLSVEILTMPMFTQKLQYIHRNPLQEKWQLADTAEDYKYSSAAFYNLNDEYWSFLTNMYFS